MTKLPTATPHSPVRRTLAATLALTIAVGAPLGHCAPPVATGSGGAVATVSEQASKAALAILNKGGNAVDAAVAAAATLGVTDPFSCGIGGGGFMVIYLADGKRGDGRRVITNDHREAAPAAFTPAVSLENGKEINVEQAVASGAAVGAAGTTRSSATARCRSGRCWRRRSPWPTRVFASARPSTTWST